ncbi:MAG: CatB-related O-acetyltransferase [Coriobacteriia bacterium]|nr:CatB-related O-acetyltransferase [Coriobacteriia bacterium]
MAAAERFASSYSAHPAQAAHTLHVVYGGREPSPQESSPFEEIAHDSVVLQGAGESIGAFEHAARAIDCDMMVFLDPGSYFTHPGWLRRMVDIFLQHGLALYGASTSFDPEPHVRATGFWCDPALVRAYPRLVTSAWERRAFEVGELSLTRLAQSVGVPCLLATWEVVASQNVWGIVPNTFERGDQRDALVRDDAFDEYEAMDGTARQLAQRRNSASRKGIGWYTKETVTNPLYEVGEYSYGTPLIGAYGDGARLRIGRFCSIAAEVQILLGGNHRPDWVTTYPFPAAVADWPEAADIQGTCSTKGDVVIGSDVWLGHGATILSGVTIGHGAVVGAKAVVAKDIPPYAIAVGNPARVVKLRFSEETVAKLLATSWWDWPVERIHETLPLLCSGAVDEFLAAAAKAD